MSILDFKIEVLKISFVNTDTMTVSFSNSYTTVPSIVATSINNAASIEDNLSVYIDNASTTHVTVRISAIANADVEIQIIGN
jgi:hypothetical protein